MNSCPLGGTWDLQFFLCLLLPSCLEVNRPPPRGCVSTMIVCSHRPKTAGPNSHKWKPVGLKVHSFPWIAQGLSPPGLQHGRERKRPNSSFSFPAAEWSVTYRGAVNCNMLKSRNALGVLKKLTPLKIHNSHMVAHLLDSPLTSPNLSHLLVFRV